MRIGLVLSGGMIKGAYQIGALRAIEQFLMPRDFRCISCSSVGTLNGYAFSVGKLDEIEQMWRDMCDEDNTSVLVSTIMRSSLLQKDINKICSPDDPMHRSFYTTLFNFNKLTVKYQKLSELHREDIPIALKASVAMPVYNKSVQLGEERYFDGAMVDNIPVFPVCRVNPDYLICVYFDGESHRFENPYFDSKIIKICIPGDTFIRESFFLNRESLDRMIDEGYRRTLIKLNSVFGNGTDDLDYIYKYIAYQNKAMSKEEFRITGDVIVSGVNTVARRLAKRVIT